MSDEMDNDCDGREAVDEFVQVAEAAIRDSLMVPPALLGIEQKLLPESTTATDDAPATDSTTTAADDAPKPPLPSALATPDRRGHAGTYNVTCPHCRRRAVIQTEPGKRPIRVQVRCPKRRCKREFWAVFDDLLRGRIRALKAEARARAEAGGGGA